MHLDFNDMTGTERYFLLTQSVLPRPIAWVMTEQQGGSMNLAPYSFFAPVCSDPATLVVSMGHKPGGEEKDSYANLKRTGHCVVHIPAVANIDAVNQSSVTWPADVSEVEELGLSLSPFTEGGLPRLSDAEIAFACEFQQEVTLGPGQQHIVFLTVNHMYVADACVEQDAKGRQKINPEVVNPLARLGATEYAALGELLSRARPK